MSDNNHENKDVGAYNRGVEIIRKWLFTLSPFFYGFVCLFFKDVSLNIVESVIAVAILGLLTIIITGHMCFILKILGNTELKSDNDKRIHKLNNWLSYLFIGCVLVTTTFISYLIIVKNPPRYKKQSAKNISIFLKDHRIIIPEQSKDFTLNGYIGETEFLIHYDIESKSVGTNSEATVPDLVEDTGTPTGSDVSAPL